MKHKALKISLIILTSLSGALTLTGFIGGPIMDGNSAAMNMFFHAETSHVVNKQGESDPEKLKYFRSDYEDVNGKVIQQKDEEVSQQVEAEGVVLLWNENDTLPLKNSAKVSLLSHSSVSLVETGTGSGWLGHQSYSSDLKTALRENDITVNQTLWDFYSSGAGSTYKRTDMESQCKQNVMLSVNEVPWSAYTDEVKDSFSSYGDAAIIVLSRTGGEYSDARGHGVDTKDKNYLALSSAEKDLLEHAIQYKNAGTFSKVVLLINSGNPLQFDELSDYMSDIDAAMYVGQPGTYGTRAIADLLVGKVSPSGRLTDTWCFDNTTAPSCMNDSDKQYANASSFTLQSKKYSEDYMVYQEGVYIGYRYYETRYEDSILFSSERNVGDFDYDKTVLFPFGYGISYTQFSYSDYHVQEKDDFFEISVKVTNTGLKPGKEVVQIYLQKPYTQHDQNVGIEKSAVELASYTKTKELQPEESVVAHLTVDKKQLRTYDSFDKKTYIAEGGDYYFSVGKDSHSAINNILSMKGSDKVHGDATLSYRISMKEDFADFSKNEETNVKITNQLDLGDINTYENAGENHVTYVSRKNWLETLPITTAELLMTEGMAKDLSYDKPFEEDPKLEYPDYEEDNHLTAFSFKDASWDDEHWDDLLDEMSWDEQALLCANGYHHTQEVCSIALPSTNEENGPVGITKRSDFPLPTGEDFQYVAYPNGPIMGSSFNDELIENMGKHMSEDMLYTKYSGIYGPGVNLHRTAFCGRAWEYPSEDPYLTGKICASEIKGIQNKGAMAFAKHFALNDLETNRRHVSIWCNEQVSREIYLQAFEYALLDGECYAMMNSFTRIGPKWCGACPELITDILRDEWGWKGINISDWDSGGPMSKIDGLLAGTDSFDGNNTAEAFREWEFSPTVAHRLRESSKRIIYTLLKTNAFNGISADSKVVPITPWWHTMIWTVGYVSLGVTLICLGSLMVVIIKDKREH